MHDHGEHKTQYTCPMHSEVLTDSPGTCPKCGMTLVPVEDSTANDESMDHDMHSGHVMKPVTQMTWWEKFKMSMTMAMGMEHSGLAGREMAKLMEEDIRNKFFVALLLTVPVIYFTMVNRNSWAAFAFTTSIYFYSGWIFLYSTYKALRAKTLNMAVLIAVGITAAYAFSVVLTLLGSEESFYEAAAMLTTFVLFGHWMEMKSRRGTTDALQALFNLVPPQARLWKDGKETLVSTSDVKLGDILILKPGDKVPVDGDFAAKVFSALQEIPIRMISYGGSHHNISVLVKTELKKQTLQALSNNLLNA